MYLELVEFIGKVTEGRLKIILIHQVYLSSSPIVIFCDFLSVVYSVQCYE